MAKTVFILGAGASAQAGLPLMKNFLDEAEILLQARHFPEGLEYFQNVFNIISKMQLIQSKAQFDLVNIESVFAAIEFGKLLGVNFDMDIDSEVLTNSIIFLIYRTIEQKTVIINHKSNLGLPRPYGEFITVMKDYIEKEGSDSLALLTFNYDILLDFSIHKIDYFSDYGLPSRTVNPSIALYKLHGSINWGRCEKCNKFIPWPIGDYIKSKSFDDNPEEVKKTFFTPGKEITSIDCPSCHQKVQDRPFIVPPTWNKTQYHYEIAYVWAQAAKHLAEAENIFVIGYSLPDTDYFFHYLYAVGTMGTSRIKNFWVCNPDKNVDERFRKILGQQALQRYKFVNEGFDITTNIIRHRLLT